MGRRPLATFRRRPSSGRHFRRGPLGRSGRWSIRRSVPRKCPEAEIGTSRRAHPVKLAHRREGQGDLNSHRYPGCCGKAVRVPAGRRRAVSEADQSNGRAGGCTASNPIRSPRRWYGGSSVRPRRARAVRDRRGRDPESLRRRIAGWSGGVPERPGDAVAAVRRRADHRARRARRAMVKEKAIHGLEHGAAPQPATLRHR